MGGKIEKNMNANSEIPKFQEKHKNVELRKLKYNK